MDRFQAQENLAQLLNAQSLLGRLSTPRREQAGTAHSDARVVALEVKAWPREVLSLKLRDRLDTGTVRPAGPSLIEHIDVRRLVPVTSSEPAQPRPQLSQEAVHPGLASDQLNRLLEVFTTDVLAARDRLLMLNPTRRKAIEHRLEFIARKVARARGERLNRSLSLLEVLKESYRDALPGQPLNPSPKLGIAAWRGFVSEVALYNLHQHFS
jgi:hypothetical protein